MKTVFNNKKVFFAMRKNKANKLKNYDITEDKISSNEFALNEKELHYFDDDLTEEQAKEAFLHNSKKNASKIFEKYL